MKHALDQLKFKRNIPIEERMARLVKKMTNSPTHGLGAFSDNFSTPRLQKSSRESPTHGLGAFSDNFSTPRLQKSSRESRSSNQSPRTPQFPSTPRIKVSHNAFVASNAKRYSFRSVIQKSHPEWATSSISRQSCKMIKIHIQLKYWGFLISSHIVWIQSFQHSDINSNGLVSGAISLNSK